MSGTQSMPTKATALARLQAMIAGLQKHFPNGSFTLGNVPYTTAALVTIFQAVIDAINAVNVAHAAAKEAVAALNGAKAKAGPVYTLLRRSLVTTYGGAAQLLEDYGLTPPKARTPLTAEQKTAAAAKAKATRKARGTASKKQKRAVKGGVTGVQVTPIVSVPAVADPTATAQTAPNASTAPNTGASK